MRLSPMIVCLALLLSACASTTQVNVRYLGNGAPAPIHSLVLAARTPENSYRNVWENTCRQTFAKLPLTLTTGGQIAPDGFDTDAKQLTDWAIQHQFDAVLVVDITGLLLAPPQMPTNDTAQIGALQRAPREDPIGVPTWHLFLGSKSKDLPEPPLLHQVEAQLLDAHGKMLWDALLTTHEANDLGAIAASQCEAIKTSLQQQHLIIRAAR